MNRKVLIFSFTILLALTLSASAAQRPIARIDNFITTGVAVSGGTYFFGDSIGNCHASRKWTYDAGGATVIGTPAVQGSSVIFAQADGSIACLEISDGSLIWEYIPESSESVNEGLNDGVAVGGGKVYAAFTTGELKAFDLKSGQVMWTYKAEQGLRTAPAYYDGLVLLGEYNGLFSMIDAETGERLNGGGAGGAINTPTVNGGNVYYSAWDGSINAVQIKNVIPLWHAKAGDPITSAPAVSSGLLVVSTATGKIVAFSLEDGARLWEYDSQGGDAGSKPVIRNGRVFAGTGDRRVLVLDAKNGGLIREISPAHALSSNDGRLYFVNDERELFAAE